ncbi:MAG: transcription termination factor NusA [Fusobacterium gastrosuis]|uniref:transcription termination factor NusA n=1 Tax=Fusobacterium TaxID=848 RepID=UPI001F4F25EC|nr:MULTISPECIES: transcription termination factor NusA [Fusobacterium]MDD7392647.1 transcription termination factor NusA [Fusobacteriaceae bacterium]MCI5724295.1 transcription termination factor NusA [Fusobacterium sp.]MCI7224368.1 transcription termination factor NusA [Fusobacterium sp.]MDD7410388.1 transcription termination factor NusA [Fusobacteriaceae bacterium]MDY4011694.1 transcription termination factor NusA [Fusobacterium gastrosuis]
MKAKDSKIFLEALDELEREKGIGKESVLEAVELALLAAYKKNYGEDENVEVTMDRESGDIRVFVEKNVVNEEDLLDPNQEISLEDALFIKKKIKVGDTLKLEVNCEDFRRNAIQNAKQIVIQKVREAEREYIYDKFKEKENDIVTGVIRRIDEKRNIFIEILGVELMLIPAEQCPTDVYRVGERIKVYVSTVEKTNKFPKIIISRKNEGLLRKLFELEIPEITSGMIEIKSVAREAGSRAKVAVHSEVPNLDIVGACVGQKGTRIKNIVNELNGEKIDIVIWKEEIKDFVSAVLSPAEVESVEVLEDGTAKVLVKPSQLSLAIGKNGQNARLAARLTGMRVDIKVTDNEEI